MNSIVQSIEEIILSNDRRGISALKRFLPLDFCKEAAKIITNKSGNALIITGFYIIGAGMPETDGPAGSLSIGHALTRLGYTVYYVTDKFTESLLHGLVEDQSKVITFPVMNSSDSQLYANELLKKYNPSLLISVERCGSDKAGSYFNKDGDDISQFNANIDCLFNSHKATIGIGDGGNEIGMGNVADAILTIDVLTKNPCVIKTTKLIIASVSNWGAYGLVAALSRLAGDNFLPSIEAEGLLIEKMVSIGAVDGMTAERIARVDGFTIEENSRVLSLLHRLI
jgi:hypothetical protein